MQVGSRRTRAVFLVLVIGVACRSDANQHSPAASRESVRDTAGSSDPWSITRADPWAPSAVTTDHRPDPWVPRGAATRRPASNDRVNFT
jgi:hypothetical protein